MVSGLSLMDQENWLTMFPAVSFKKCYLFPKDLITFMVSFISLSVNAIHEPVIFEFFLILSLITLSLVSTRRS